MWKQAREERTARGSSLQTMRYIAIALSMLFGVVPIISRLLDVDFGINPFSNAITGPAGVIVFIFFWFFVVFGFGISFILWVFAVIINIYVKQPLPNKVRYLFIGWSIAQCFFLYKLGAY